MVINNLTKEETIQSKKFLKIKEEKLKVGENIHIR